MIREIPANRRSVYQRAPPGLNSSRCARAAQHGGGEATRSSAGRREASEGDAQRPPASTVGFARARVAPARDAAGSRRQRARSVPEPEGSRGVHRCARGAEPRRLAEAGRGPGRARPRPRPDGVRHRRRPWVLHSARGQAGRTDGSCVRCRRRAANSGCPARAPREGRAPQRHSRAGAGHRSAVAATQLRPGADVDAYHHFPDRPNYLRRLAALLRPGGRLANVDWHKRPSDFGPPLEHRIAREDFLADAARAGLRAVSEPKLLRTSTSSCSLRGEVAGNPVFTDGDTFSGRSWMKPRTCPATSDTARRT